MFKTTDMSDTKTGDTILYEKHNLSSSSCYLKSVDRTTKTMIVVWDRKFHRDGRERGAAGWREDHIFALTPENREEAKAKAEATRLTDELNRLANRLRQAQWKMAPLETLKQIAALLGWSE